MLADELINRLERLGLLDQEIIEALREQLDQGTRVTPEAIAKLLVDNGQLTHFQATKLIGELRSGDYEDASPDDGDSGSSLNDDLLAGFEDDDELEPQSDASPASAESAADAGHDRGSRPVDQVENDVDLVEADSSEAIPVEPAMVYEAEPVEVASAEAFSADVELTAPDALGDAAGLNDPSALPTRRPQRTRKKPDPEKSIWDSFKVYGWATIIILLLVLGGFFWFVLNKESEDEFIQAADKFYEQQNYDAAQEYYAKFLETFGEDSQYASRARTRVTMTELYKAASFKNKPWEAVDLAKEKLPIIAEEPGMNDDRGNLAALLVDIARNVAVQADRAKETAQKQSLLAKLDEQWELMENPLYMPRSMRTTLEAQIQEVEEAHARVQREINRNIRLDQAEAEMKVALDQNQTKAAYDIRKSLLRDFPELHDDERLEALIRRASEIQKTLVKPSTKLPKTVLDPPADVPGRSIVLTNLVGSEVPDLEGETVYIRARGSILAFDGATGKLRWRKYVGESDELPPLRLDDGVILSQSANYEILRCDEQDGREVWRCKIEEPFTQPMEAGDDIFLSTAGGRLIALDAESGDAKWATQIPQPLESSPGVDDRAKLAYLAGDHSNLYVLNTRNGSCLESFYIGHEEGTISVPPVPLMGHLFVVENAGSDYANVHVLSLDDQGIGLKVAQSPFRLIGNVQVAPIVQGRRLIVLTDLGQVVLLDIEPTSEREKVSIAAKLPPFYDRPTATQMAVNRTQMWITGNEIARYELQISTGRINRATSKHALDTFIGQPFATDDALVYARILRGTTAVRVTAAEPKTMNEIWSTDVGVPVSMITQAPEGGFHAVTSQAALFALDRESLQTGSTTGPIENPGKNAVAIRFEDPIAIDESRSLMVNQVDGQSLIVYEPQRERQKLRQVTMQLTSGRPANRGVVVGNEMFMPLDTGRAVMINWRTGAVAPGAYQPASDPTAKVKWTEPLPLPDDREQVVLADSRRKIYRLRIGDRIRELASRDMEYELLGPTAAVNGTMLATTAGPSADFLVGFEMATLSESFKTLLNGRVLWGPISAGEVALVVTDDGMLRGVGADGTQRFKTPLPDGLPVGRPVVDGDQLILAGKPGWIVVLDSTSGTPRGEIDLGQPLSATPLQVGSNLLVPGNEGVIYIVAMPE